MLLAGHYRIMSSSGGGLNALKRLMTEYKGIIAPCPSMLKTLAPELSLNAPEGITAGPLSEDNFFVWEAIIE